MDQIQFAAMTGNMVHHGEGTPQEGYYDEEWDYYSEKDQINEAEQDDEADHK